MSDRNIYELIARSTNGQLNAEDELALTNWRNASLENEAEYQELFQILSVSVLQPDPELADTDNEWAKLSAKLSSRESAPQPVVIPFRRKLMRYAAVAASVIVLVTVGWLLFNPGDSLKEQTYFASEGQQKKIKLTDGSDILLYSGTEMTTDKAFGKENRDLKLKGEADFEVARNEKMPFIIDAGKSTVTVLGTQFNVKAYDENNKVNVSVKSGKVKFAAKEGGSSVILTKGEAGVFDPATGEVTLVRTLASLSEVNGVKTLVFEHKLLSEAIPEMELFYGVEFRLPEEMKSEPIHGTFTEDLDKTIEKLELAYNIKAEVDGKIVTLK